MEPTQELIDDIYREKVERARRMSADQKLRAGPELHDLGCELVLAGLRMQFPNISGEELKKKFWERLELARRLDER